MRTRALAILLRPLHRFCFELLVLRKATINLLAIADANDQDSQNIVVNLVGRGSSANPSSFFAIWR